MRVTCNTNINGYAQPRRRHQLGGLHANVIRNMNLTCNMHAQAQAKTQQQPQAQAQDQPHAQAQAQSSRVESSVLPASGPKLLAQPSHHGDTPF